MADFAHLHLHSEYSLLDGANKVPDIIKRVKELEMSSVAITDHGVMFGVIDFYKAAHEEGIKPILGCEVYLSPTTRTERGPRASYNHLVLLAQNYQGYLNLCKLTSIGYMEGFYRKARIDHEVLARYNEGLICLSACLQGEVAQSMLEKSDQEARARAALYKDIFGPERFFLEIQDHGIDPQHRVMRGMPAIAKDLGLQIVASNDAHYLTKEHVEPHDCLLCIGTGKRKSDRNRMRYEQPEFYIKSPRQMHALFREFPGACELTAEIAASCDCEIPFGQRLYPKYPWTDGKSAADYLRERVDEGLMARYGRIEERIAAQSDFELGVIGQTGFEDYFLVVWDFIRFARTQGIPVGPGRGSGAGSLVAYALQITDVDPLVHGLLFERFLNPERVSAPDFDIDFCFERRGEVIEYVKRKYGAENVAQIITFGTLKPKAAIRDVGRVLEVPLHRVDQIAKLLPEGPTAPKNLEEALKVLPELRKEYDVDRQVRELIDTAKAIEGTSRHASVHAAGVVIADRELASLVPIYKAPGTEDLVVQYTMGTVEKLGLLKMDFLGLKNLTIIHNAVKNVEAFEGIAIDWEPIPLDEPATYKFLCQGQTLGLFQLESGGMRDVVKRLQPTSFADISAVLALYRPGPMEAGMVDDYINRKHGRAEVDYFHPLLEEILAETYGTIIYQEQVMKIAQIMAGYSLGSADLLRRAMGKKKKEAMDAERPSFVEGCLQQGHPLALANQLFDIMAKFAGYGFNKSHTVAYAMITFRTAYLMAHHPVSYLAALLTNEIFGAKATEKIPLYIGLCRDMKVAVLPPDVNSSNFQFTVVPSADGRGAIRFGMGAIKGVGRGVVDEVVRARAEGGAFASLRDFCERVNFKVLNARIVEALIRTGAFDSIAPNRAAALHILPEVLELAGDAQRERASGQTNMFALIEEAAPRRPGVAPRRAGDELPDLPDWTTMEKLRGEKELIGFYVSGHPLDRWRMDIDCFQTLDSARMTALADEAAEAERQGLPSMASREERPRTEIMVGLVANVLNKVTRGGQPMAFLQMEDFFGFFEVIIFPRSYDKYHDILVPGSVLAIEGRPDLAGRTPKFLAERIFSPDSLRRERVRFLDIELPAGELNARTFTQLMQVIAHHKGGLPCRFALRDNGSSVTFQPRRARSVGIDPTEEAFDALRRTPLRPELRLAN